MNFPRRLPKDANSMQNIKKESFDSKAVIIRAMRRDHYRSGAQAQTSGGDVARGFGFVVETARARLDGQTDHSTIPETGGKKIR